MDALIELSEVTKRYAAGGVPALDRVSLAVAAGEAVAVMGPSGSGKSTLLNLVAGLDRPSVGTVTVAGQRVDTRSETRLARYRRRQVGMIFQFFNLLDDLSVADNVLLPAQLAGTPRRRARARCAEPTGAVDTAAGAEIGQLLLDLNAAGQTLVLVTHSPELAGRYAKRTVRLLDGRIASDTFSGRDVES